jgi:hypothetical protein
VLGAPRRFSWKSSWDIQQQVGRTSSSKPERNPDFDVIVPDEFYLVLDDEYHQRIGMIRKQAMRQQQEVSSSRTWPVEVVEAKGWRLKGSGKVPYLTQVGCMGRTPIGCIPKTPVQKLGSEPPAVSLQQLTGGKVCRMAAQAQDPVVAAAEYMCLSAAVQARGDGGGEVRGGGRCLGVHQAVESPEVIGPGV